MLNAVKKIELLNSEKSSKILIPSNMESYYIEKMNYTRLKDSFVESLLLKLYFFPFGKVKNILKMILNFQYIFKKPKKNNIVIFDSELLQDLSSVVQVDNCKIIDVRKDKIKEIYICKDILVFVLKNLFSRSIKQNYIIALIKLISPKLVITHIANSTDFHVTAKFFEKNQIKFLAIQNSNFAGSDYLKNTKIGRLFFLPELLCFSKWDIDLFTKGVSTVKKFNVVGSLKSANAKEYVKKNKIKIENEKYDICLISEARMDIADFTHIENYENFPGIIAEFTHRLCKKKNLKLIFAGRQKSDDPFFDMETHYYKGYLKNYDFKINQKKENEYATHVNMMQSKLIISQGSTAAREAVSFKKKVLQCGNFEGHPDIPLPVDWPCQLKDKSYEEFEKRVLTILSMSNSEYEKALSDKMSLVMEYELDTISLIKKRISQIIM